MKRPVPLDHYLHTPSGELFKIVDSKRMFLPAGYKAAMDSRKKEKEGMPSTKGNISTAYCGQHLWQATYC